MPPLSSTTAFRPSVISYALFPCSYSPCRRFPHKLMQLQSEPHRQSVLENPFHEFSRFQTLPLAFRIVKHRRKQHLPHSADQPMLPRELPRKLIIPTRPNH